MTEFTQEEYERALAMPLTSLAHLARGTRELEAKGADDPRAMEIFMDCGAAAGVWENRIGRDGKKEVYRPESTTDGYMAALHARMVGNGMIW